MKQHALQLRLQELTAQKEFVSRKIEETKSRGDKIELAKVMLEYTALEARVDEIESWLKADEKAPGYGQQIRAQGMWRPKLPTYGSVELAIEAMNSPDGGFGVTPEAVAAGRAFRAEEDCREVVQSLNGRSPFIPEEERKPFRGTL